MIKSNDRQKQKWDKVDKADMFTRRRCLPEGLESLPFLYGEIQSDPLPNVQMTDLANATRGVLPWNTLSSLYLACYGFWKTNPGIEGFIGQDFINTSVKHIHRKMS